MRVLLTRFLSLDSSLLRRTLFMCLLSLGFLGGLIWLAGVRRLGEVIARVSIPGLLLAFGAYAIAWLFRTIRLWLLTSREANLKIWTAFQVYISALAINSILPARLGDATWVVLLNRKGLGFIPSALIVLQSRVLDAAGLLFGLLAALAVLVWKGKSSAGVWGGILGCFSFVFLPIGAVYFFEKVKVLRFFEKLALRGSKSFLKLSVEATGDFLKKYRELLEDRVLGLKTPLLSVALILSEGLTAWTIAWAAGVKISFFLAWFSVSFATFGKASGVTPGGIGIYEGTFAGICSLFGVPFQSGLVIGLLDHALKKAFNLAIGYPLLAWQGSGMMQGVVDLKRRLGWDKSTLNCKKVS